ncbi:multidrug efflux pump subunit AcrB [Bradyrhizobium sp. S3.9.1]
MAFPLLPVVPLPQIDFPTVQVAAQLQFAQISGLTE